MIVNKYYVDNKLIRGSTPNLSDLKNLKNEGVNQIICISLKPKILEKFACKALGIKFNQHKIDIQRGHFFKKNDFEKITSQINSNDGKTYIHCNVGLHRTGESVAAYNIISGKKTVHQAFDEDLFRKKYFEKTYFADTKIKQDDNLFTKIKKTYNKKIGKNILKSYKNFLKIVQTIKM